MRCAWSRQILWSILKPSHAVGGVAKHRIHSLSTSLLRPHTGIQSFSITYRSQFTPAVTPIAHAHTAAVKAASEKASPPQAQLSTAQISRAACNAVHLSLHNQVGGLEDAYLIVNSLRYSSIRNNPVRSSQSEKIYANDLIDFGREVSPRLSSHALLHGLLRIGHTDRATSLAMMMMETGIRLRNQTVEAVVHAALHSFPKNQLPRPTIPTQPFNVMLSQSQIGNLSSMTQDEGMRSALQLLCAARNTHHQRTSGMFGTLFTICLINGEIILASLIFGFLMKDWQLKRSFAARLREATSTESAELSAKPVDRTPYHVFPTTAWLIQILSPVNEILSRDGGDEEYQLSFASALQALAYLASFLDHRQLPFSEIAPLIYSLYKCPRVEDEVWIIDGQGNSRRVKAYAYFHAVLHRLVEVLPTWENRSEQMLYELDLSSLNALLHYTLRHRLSPALAEKILQHMRDRHNPLQPDIVTYNTLLRSGTIIRQGNIFRKALETLPLQFGPNQRHMWENASTQQNSLKPDTYTMNSYITYLTSTGQSQRVIDLCFEMFPEIRPIDHAYLPLSRAERIKLRKLDREACVKRAVNFGPYVLTALLNALLKAGKTGLMKWVWRLTREAERRNWEPDFVPEAEPWSIPIHAYTIMFQCFRMQQRRPSLLFQNTRTRQQNRERLVRVGLHLYHSMKARAMKTPGTVLTKALVPDTRLFNAVLALFLHPIRRRSKAHYRHNFRRAQHLHAYLGTISPRWDQLLQEVGEDMVRAGYAIPLGFRHIFIGRWDEGTWNLKRPPQLDRRPFAYSTSCLPSYSPFHTPVRRHKCLRPRRKRQWTKNMASVLKG